MMRTDGWCDACDSEFCVEHPDRELKVKYCPYCGSEVDDVASINLDPDYIDNPDADWED